MRNKMGRPITHGMSGTPEYLAWQSMKRRCFNSNHKDYPDWGGRGITVCDRWLNSFENFLADMGSRPTAKHSLDRIDNDSDYSVENCRWATEAEQQNNKRTNHLITIDDVTSTITQWTKKMGYGEMIIYNRLKRGWSEYDAVMTPVEIGKLITIKNETRTIVQWTEKMGYGESVIRGRLKLGWSEYRAVMTPVKLYKSA